MTRIVLLIPDQPSIEFEMELDFILLEERSESILAQALLELGKRNPQSGISKNDILIGRLAADSNTFELAPLAGSESVIHLKLIRAPAPMPVPLISPQDFIALYACLIGFEQPGNTHFLLPPKTSPKIILSKYPTHTVFYDNSLFQKQFHGTDKIINTYGDGNCAFNAAATGIADLLLLGQLDCQHELIKTLYQSLLKRTPPANPSDVRRELQQWIRTLLNANADVPADQVIALANAYRLNEMQQQMQPVIRTYVMAWIDQHRGADSYVEAFLGSYDAFLRRAVDETFVVHSHIKAQFEQWQKASPRPTDAECRTWWREKGYPQYRDNLKQNARGGGDQERWGSEVEVGALGEILNINIFLSGRGFLEESMEGPGSGYIHGLDQIDRDKLQQLGLGYNNKDRPVFVLNPDITRAMIDRAFQPSPYLELVRLYFQTQAHCQTRALPGDWTDPLLLQDLSARGVIDLRARRWIGDTNIPDTRRILGWLEGDRVVSSAAAAEAASAPSSELQIPAWISEKTLKDVVNAAWCPGLPSFYAIHGGGHWEYKIPLGQREIPLVIAEVSKRAALECAKFKALIPGKPVHVFLPLNMPDPIALSLEFKVADDNKLTLAQVIILDPNNNTKITGQLVKWFPTLNQSQIIQIPVLSAKPETAQLHTIFNFMCLAHIGKILNDILISPTLPRLIAPEQCYLSETLLALLSILKQYRLAGVEERQALKPKMGELRDALLQSLSEPAARLTQPTLNAYQNHADANFIAAEHRRCAQLKLDPTIDQAYAWVLREEQRLLCSNTEKPQRIVSHFDAFRKHAGKLLKLMEELNKHGHATTVQLQETQTFAENYFNNAVKACLDQACLCGPRNEREIKMSIRGILVARALLEEVRQQTNNGSLGPKKSQNEIIEQIDTDILMQIQDRIIGLSIIQDDQTLFGIVALLRCLEAIATNKELPCRNENYKMTADRLRELIKSTNLPVENQENLFNRLNAIMQQQHLSCVQGLPAIRFNLFSSLFNFGSFAPAGTGSLAPPPDFFSATLRVPSAIITANTDNFASLQRALQEVKNNSFYKQFFSSHLARRDNGKMQSWMDDCIEYFQNIASSKLVDQAKVTETFLNAFSGFAKVNDNVVQMTKLTKEQQQHRDQLVQHLSKVLTHLIDIGSSLGIELMPKANIPPPPSATPK